MLVLRGTKALGHQWPYGNRGTKNTVPCRPQSNMAHGIKAIRTHRQTDGCIDRQTDKQIHKQTYRWTEREVLLPRGTVDSMALGYQVCHAMALQASGQYGRKELRPYRQIDRQIDASRDTQIDRWPDIQRCTDTDR